MRGTRAIALVSAHGLVAAGRAVVVEDHLHLSVLTVDPAARRRGHGTALLAAAARWGRERGARWGVLQVAVHNTAALALYARTGWTEHHRYRYLVPPRSRRDRRFGAKSGQIWPHPHRSGDHGGGAAGAIAHPAQRPQPRPHPADDEQQRLPRCR